MDGNTINRFTDAQSQVEIFMKDLDVIIYVSNTLILRYDAIIPESRYRHITIEGRFNEISLYLIDLFLFDWEYLFFNFECEKFILISGCLIGIDTIVRYWFMTVLMMYSDLLGREVNGKILTYLVWWLFNKTDSYITPSIPQTNSVHILSRLWHGHLYKMG